MAKRGRTMKDRLYMLLDLVAAGGLDQDICCRVLHADAAYALGNSDPVTVSRPWLKRLDAVLDLKSDPVVQRLHKHYETVSGNESVVYTKQGDSLVVEAAVQGISYVVDSAHGTAEGSLLTLVTNRAVFGALAGIHIDWLICEWVGEIGTAAWMALKNVRITKQAGGISIDDITCNETYDYVAEVFLPWRPGKIMKCKSGEIYLVDRAGNKIDNPTKW